MASVRKGLNALGPSSVSRWRSLSYVDNLCQRCTTIDWNKAKVRGQFQTEDLSYDAWPRLYADQLTLRELRDTAHTGCHFCTLLLTGLQDSYKYGSEHLDQFGSALPGLDIYDDSLVTVSAGWHSADEDGVIGVVHTEVEDLQSDGVSFINRSAFDAPRADLNIGRDDIVHTWMKKCLQDHDCSKTIDQREQRPRLPTRVIDVRLTEPDRDPFLLFSAGQRETYATLSYVWGTAVHLTTTRETLNERSRKIPISSMPTTFQDAVKMTRLLGIPYLWIDALCIVQDSAEELQGELGKMADIYRNSTITFAAAAANSVQDGFISPRNDICFVPCKMSTDVFVKASRLGPSSQTYPLNMRAWCLQETLLSTRALWCGGEELYWSCHKHNYKESSWDSTWRERTEDFEDQLTASMEPEPLLVNSLASQGRKTIFNAWYDIVSLYSYRKLSVQTDKLLALTGIAAFFGEYMLGKDTPYISQPTIQADMNPQRKSRSTAVIKTQPSMPKGSQYLAGLWEHDLLRGILWFAVQPELIPSGRFPSWTWASSDAEVGYSTQVLETEDLTFHTVLINIAATPRSSLNPYGDVLDGFIVVEGPVSAGIQIQCEHLGRQSVRQVKFQTAKGEVIVEGFNLIHGCFSVELDCIELIDAHCVLLRVTTTHCLILTSIAQQYPQVHSNEGPGLESPVSTDTLQVDTYLRVGYFELSILAVSGDYPHGDILDNLAWTKLRLTIV